MDTYADLVELWGDLDAGVRRGLCLLMLRRRARDAGLGGVMLGFDGWVECGEGLGDGLLWGMEAAYMDALKDLVGHIRSCGVGFDWEEGAESVVLPALKCGVAAGFVDKALCLEVPEEFDGVVMHDFEVVKEWCACVRGEGSSTWLGREVLRLWRSVQGLGSVFGGGVGGGGRRFEAHPYLEGRWEAPPGSRLGVGVYEMVRRLAGVHHAGYGYYRHLLSSWDYMVNGCSYFLRTAAND